jgi:hypothetical protein
MGRPCSGKAMLSAPASGTAVCALRSDLAAISAVTVRSGKRMHRSTRGLLSGAVMAGSSVASSVLRTLSHDAVSVGGAGGEGSRISRISRIVPIHVWVSQQDKQDISYTHTNFAR